VEVDEMGRACSMNEEEEERIKVTGGKTRGIILRWILERWDGVMWTGLVWLRIG
jgi:hypothetical protein